MTQSLDVMALGVQYCNVLIFSGLLIMRLVQ